MPPDIWIASEFESRRGKFQFRLCMLVPLIREKLSFEVLLKINWL
jgi:hypothetical protein